MQVDKNNLPWEPARKIRAILAAEDVEELGHLFDVLRGQNSSDIARLLPAQLVLLDKIPSPSRHLAMLTKSLSRNSTSSSLLWLLVGTLSGSWQRQAVR